MPSRWRISAAGTRTMTSTACPRSRRARGAILSDRHMADWNRQTFGQDKGVPAGIVNIRDFISDNRLRAAQARMAQQLWRGGAQDRFPARRRHGVAEYRPQPHRSRLPAGAGGAARPTILNIFGIPVGLVSENATEANAKVAERQFIERTLYPKLVRIAQKISQELLPFYGEKPGRRIRGHPPDRYQGAPGGDSHGLPAAEHQRIARATTSNCRQCPGVMSPWVVPLIPRRQPFYHRGR